MVKIIHKHWFTEAGSFRLIGIIVGIGAVGELKAYIGTSDGSDSDTDANYIAANGAKLTVGMLEAILRELKGE